MKNTDIKLLFVVPLVILSLLFSAGCGVLSTTNTSVPSSPPASTSIPATPPVNGGTSSSQSTPPFASTQAPALPNIADVVAKVKPSVVAINTEITGLDFFNRPSSEDSAGSGWIIREDGLIITNNHVVEGAKTISVTLDDGRTFSVDLKTVATDPLIDLAVLRIDAANLPAVQVGDSSKMRVGDWVVAIGNSLGEGTRATQGIISRKNASVPLDRGQTLYGLIETDAAINPGNSGGPLVNMAGQVIGITSAKLAAVGIEATGFAISTETAMPIIQQLIDTGRAVHPWLGVSLYTLDQLVIQTYNLAVDKGALIVDVTAGSPADNASLKPRDVIVGFDGKQILSLDDLTQAIRQSNVGQKVEIIYWRGETKGTTSATLTERPQ
ncbi:MAG: hypothetical protein A2144_10840 [Chloroflexi bacterium RBG_16_50_9]|nr:MAG: hypothetical protein A2144_10840 [Chloroflexi bacterium RBG_16_50_9]